MRGGRKKQREREKERDRVRGERGERVSEREATPDQMDLSGKAKPNYKGRICIPHGTEYGTEHPLHHFECSLI